MRFLTENLLYIEQSDSCLLLENDSSQNDRQPSKWNNFVSSVTVLLSCRQIFKGIQNHSLSIKYFKIMQPKLR